MLKLLLELTHLIETARAQGGPVDTSFRLFDPFAGHDFQWVVGKIADFLLLIGAPITGIMVLVGGYFMITSGGSSERFTTGRKTILYAVVGFVALLLAKGVAAVIQRIFV